MANDRGLLLVLSGPSGSGKGTIVKKLLDEREDTVVSVSVTTRKPRPGEVDGVHYFFRTREQFERMIAENRLLEYAEYNGNYYGTPRDAVEQWMTEGKNVILEIEVQGAEKVMSNCTDLVSIFIGVPSVKELEQRLRGRGTETDDVIAGRMKASLTEFPRACHYQYVVMNDEVDLAVGRINHIIEAEKMRYIRVKDKMEVFRNVKTE